LFLPVEPELTVFAVPIDEEAKGDDKPACNGDPQLGAAQVKKPE
jgi:hypothetical protein